MLSMYLRGELFCNLKGAITTHGLQMKIINLGQMDLQGGNNTLFGTGVIIKKTQLQVISYYIIK